MKTSVPTQKRDLFNTAVIEYLEYPTNMNDRQKDVVFNAAMKAIAKLHRAFKSKLVNRYLAKGVAPFQSYKHLKQEDWDTFVQMKNSEQFKKESEEKKQLRAKNKHDHRIGPSGYAGKRAKWQAEDEKLAREGRENPWNDFPGRSRSYLRARGELTESGEITFRRSETQEVAQRVREKAAEASQGSFTGARERDVLTAALGNPEHPGRVRGVSSSQGWKHGFPEDIGMYKKRKRSEPVDVRAMEISIAQRIMSSIVGQLAAKGIEIEMPAEFS